jgi:hypothetical protein
VLIGLNIIIGGSFDSTEAAITMNFVRATGVQGKRIAAKKRIYARDWFLAVGAVEVPNGRQHGLKLICICSCLSWKAWNVP